MTLIKCSSNLGSQKAKLSSSFSNISFLCFVSLQIEYLWSFDCWSNKHPGDVTSGTFIDKMINQISAV